MMAAVKKVNANAGKHPNQEAQPVGRGEREHKKQAKHGASDRNKRDKGTFEGAVRIGIDISHNEDSGAYYYEGKECADIDKFSEDAKRNQG